MQKKQEVDGLQYKKGRQRGAIGLANFCPAGLFEFNNNKVRVIALFDEQKDGGFAADFLDRGLELADIRNGLAFDFGDERSDINADLGGA